MPQRDIALCPLPDVLRDFCLEELYPQFLFRYMTPRDPRNTENADAEYEFCSLVFAESPSDFTAQLDPDRRAADRISYQLTKVYEKAEPVDNYNVTDQFLHEGVPVAARYVATDDLRWFRAIIVKIDKTPNVENPIRIRFVDFGNYQDNKLEHLKMMPIDMGNDPPLAIKCRIKGTSEGDLFHKTINDNFSAWRKKLEENKCLVSFCSFDAAANQHIVRLHNAVTGDEYALPPDTVPIGNSITSAVVLVEDLIKLDIEANGDLIQDLVENPINDDTSGPSTTAAGMTKATSLYEEELKEIFTDNAPQSDSASASASASATSSGQDRAEVEEKEIQTDGRVKKTEATLGEEDVTAAPPYDAFGDPQFEELGVKYPDLVKYLKAPDY